MVNRVVGFIKSHKKQTLIVIVLLGVAIAVAGVLIANNASNSNSDSAEKKPKVISAPSYDYVYVSSDVTCAQVQPYPNAPNTVNNCTGKLSVKTEPGGDARSFKVTSSTQYISKNGVPIDLAKLGQLQSGKSKLSINPAGEKTDTANIIISTDQLN